MSAVSHKEFRGSQRYFIRSRIWLIHNRGKQECQRVALVSSCHLIRFLIKLIRRIPPCLIPSVAITHHATRPRPMSTVNILGSIGLNRAISSAAGSRSSWNRKRSSVASTVESISRCSSSNPRRRCFEPTTSSSVALAVPDAEKNPFWDRSGASYLAPKHRPQTPHSRSVTSRLCDQSLSIDEDGDEVGVRKTYLHEVPDPGRSRYYGTDRNPFNQLGCYEKLASVGRISLREQFVQNRSSLGLD